MTRIHDTQALEWPQVASWSGVCNIIGRARFRARFHKVTGYHARCILFLQNEKPIFGVEQSEALELEHAAKLGEGPPASVPCPLQYSHG